MIALGVSIFFVVVAYSSPLILSLMNLDPYTIDRDAIDIEYFNYPKGPWGGISTEHIFGVEPGVGRDVFARLLIASNQ